MKVSLRLVAVILLALLPTRLPAQTAKPTPPPKAGGLAVTTSDTPPSGAKKAEIKDLRVLGGKEQELDPYQLERVAVSFAQSGDLEKARQLFEQSWKLGQLPSALFNLACLDVRQGKNDSAYRQLDRAIAAGFDDEPMLASDADLAPIRSSSRFQGVVAGARKNAAAGDAAVVREGSFLAPTGKPVGILVLFHDASSDPLSIASPFLAGARARGLFVAAPRGPSKAGRKRFGWGSPERATAAVALAIREARKRVGNLPVVAAGVGRGGMVATYFAATQPGILAGAATIGGPFDLRWIRSEAAATALKGTRLFLGVSLGTDAQRLQAFRQGRDGLKSAGVNAGYAEWPGTGDGLPTNVGKAVDEVLTALLGR